MEPVETIEHKGYNIVIECSDWAENPFESWDFPKSLIIKTGRDNWVIGEDEDDLIFESEHEFEPWDERYFLPAYEDDYCEKASKDIQTCVNCREKANCRMLWQWRQDNFDYWWERKAIQDQEKEWLILPIYKYDHSGVIYNTAGFSCPWDSGCVGYIAMRYNDEIPKDHLEIYLENQVKLLSCWASGQVYGYVIKKDDENLDSLYDSCWGFYCEYNDDEWKYMIATAKQAVDTIDECVWQDRKQVVVDFNTIY
jgi:hypothetical protein